jgi:hypothetical protein
MAWKTVTFHSKIYRDYRVQYTCTIYNIVHLHETTQHKEQSQAGKETTRNRQLQNIHKKTHHNIIYVHFQATNPILYIL